MGDTHEGATAEAGTAEEEGDTLHIMPLAAIRLQTPALRRARIVKNTRLEGMIEMFAGGATGSGQIRPAELPKFIDMRGPQKTDMMIVKRLCSLASYDVYSLRVSLKELGIKVDNMANLRISRSCTRQLSPYVGRYTQPMLESIFGEARAAIVRFEDIATLLTQEGAQEDAREKLVWLAAQLQIKLRDVPLFISEYGDVSGSLAYYEYCLDKVAPTLDSFLQALVELRESRLRTDMDLVQTCRLLEDMLARIRASITALFGHFEGDTKRMWRDISAAAFNDMKRQARACYKDLGGGLCAMTVKMDAWRKRFPSPAVGGLPARAEFVRQEMRPGMEMPARIGGQLETGKATV